MYSTGLCRAEWWAMECTLRIYHAIRFLHQVACMGPINLLPLFPWRSHHSKLDQIKCFQLQSTDSNDRVTMDPRLLYRSVLNWCSALCCAHIIWMNKQYELRYNKEEAIASVWGFSSHIHQHLLPILETAHHITNSALCTLPPHADM